MLSYTTTSNASKNLGVDDPLQMLELHEHLEKSFPLVFSSLQVEKVGLGNLSLLLTWRGQAQSELPVLFVSHMDVVPVTPGTEAAWKHGPFSGDISDGFVWGRGALDVKVGVFLLLAAVEELLIKGFAPQRSLYFAFGQDEEVGGQRGAGVMAALLQSRGVVLAAVYDEGGVVLRDGLRPFTPRPTAIVATAEKATRMWSVTLHSTGGHSSAPPTDGSDIGSQIMRLIRALQTRPLPRRLQSPATDMLHGAAPLSSSPVLRYLYANCHRWPLSALAVLALRRTPATTAMVQSTCAVTRVYAGVADNVLPQRADITINCRLLPGDSERFITKHLRSVIAAAHINASLARSRLEGGELPPPADQGSVTSRHDPYFKVLETAIMDMLEVDGQPLAVVPYQLTGGTDSRHYTHLARHKVLRFVPVSVNRSAGELDTIHGTNERVRVADLKQGICLYARLYQLLG